MPGFVATVWQVAPLSESFMGYNPAKRAMFGIGPERCWLAFTQRTSRFILDRTPPQEFDRQPLPTSAGGQPAFGSDFIYRYATRRAAYWGEISKTYVPAFVEVK